MDPAARFNVTKLLDTGGQGHARLARDRVLGETCVLKLARSGSDAAAQLTREALALADLEHPHLVRIICRIESAPFEPDGPPLSGFATQWIDGKPLHKELDGRPIADVMATFAQLVDATAYLHRRNLLHLDIKPENVVVGERGVVLLDLGSALPADTLAGEAGGTIGYAAPEVHAGQAASPAADVYSLGAVLYELLTGVRLTPAGVAGDDPGFFVEDWVPVRALRPDAPRDLARLCEDMLSADPAGRPATARDVARRMEEIGFPVKLHAGSPPFVEQADARAHLSDLLAGPPALIAVVGGTGSGRTRLVRHALLTEPAQPLAFLDLTLAAKPVGAVRAALALARAMPSSRKPVIWLGRREQLDAPTRAALDARAPAMVEAGFHVVWASPSALLGAAEARVSPIRERGAATIGGSLGVAEPALLKAALRQSGGLPGPLLRALGADDAAPTSLGAAFETVRDILATLPPGIPAAVVDTLPDVMIDAVPALVDARAAWWGADGRLWLRDTRPDVPIAPDLAPLVDALLRDARGAIDDLWAGLAAVRLGDVGEARRRLDVALAARSERTGELTALARAVAQADDPVARAVFARLTLQAGDFATVLALLEAVDRSGDEEVLFVQALRQARRYDEAERIARASLSNGGPPGLWIELAHVALARNDVERAEEACRLAAEADPVLRDGDALTLQLRIAVERIDRGESPANLPDLLSRVEARIDHVPSVTLSAAGRMRMRRGEFDRAQRLLRRAAHLADQEHDNRRAAGIRLNLGNALTSLGRPDEARATYDTALTLAQSAGLDPLLLRVRHALCDLDLRAGRLPSAAAHLAELDTLLARAGDADARERVGLLRAHLLFEQGRVAESRQVLAALDPNAHTGLARTQFDILQAQHLLEEGKPTEALALLQATPRPKETWDLAPLELAIARAHLALARQTLARARARVPDHPENALKLESGRILLAAAGEDLDPTGFPARRADLERAALLLTGEPAARAVSLRERLLDAPGARLSGIVALAESIRDPDEFPRAVARLVSEALGAHRVLIWVKMGFGDVAVWNEISGAQAAGIVDEVKVRIRDVGSVWTSGDAVADPALSRSRTVQTFKLRSLLAVAIPRGQECIGALYVDDLYRANRFGEAELELLRRLARAVGQLLPLVQNAEIIRALPEPREMLGVLLSDRRDIEDFEQSIQMLRGREQANVLITGPTGAGKTVLAERIARDVLGTNGIETVVLHEGNPEMLLTTLAGRRRGEFTGALDAEGALRRAMDGGRALFLDEVQNLDKAGQQILLPLLDGVRKFSGLTGSTSALGRPLHIILGTNADVAHGRWQNHFRADLWYRMCQVQIGLPPLRARGRAAIYAYLSRILAARGYASPEEIFDARARALLTGLPWYGNLRELTTFADRAGTMYRNNGEVLGIEAVKRLLPNEPPPPAERPGSTPLAVPGVPSFDVGALFEALVRNGFKQKPAASELGLSPSGLNKQLKRHGLLAEVKRRRRELRDRTQRPEGGWHAGDPLT